MANHWETVATLLYTNEIDGAESYLESRFRELGSERFRSLTELRFNNSPISVFRHIKSFVDECQAMFEVSAVYLEMNGFDINYNRWFFDSFAYDTAGEDADETEWLCDWTSPDWPEFTLNGLEKVQDDFRWYVENEIYKVEGYKQAKELATLLVMVRFLQLIRDSLEAGTFDKSIIVIANAHDFDMFGRFTTKCINVR